MSASDVPARISRIFRQRKSRQDEKAGLGKSPAATTPDSDVLKGLHEPATKPANTAASKAKSTSSPPAPVSDVNILGILRGTAPKPSPLPSPVPDEAKVSAKPIQEIAASIAKRRRAAVKPAVPTASTSQTEADVPSLSARYISSARDDLAGHSSAPAPVAYSARLPLPSSYERLLKTFAALETAWSFALLRKQQATFWSLKRPIEKITLRTLNLDHLRQIKHIYPLAFEWAAKHMIDSNTHERKVDYIFDKTAVNDKGALSVIGDKARTQEFHKRLLDNVFISYKSFLESNDMPLPSGKLVDWAPAFDVESLPAIPMANLPVLKSVRSAATVSVIKENASDAEGSASLKRNVLDVLKSRERKNNPEIVASVLSRPVQKDLATLPASLLERVRQKEITNHQERNSDARKQRHRCHLLERLPGVCDVIRSVMNADRRTTMEKLTLARRIAEVNRSGVSAETAARMLDMLVADVPEFLSEAVVAGRKYVKLGPSSQFSGVKRKLADMLAEET